MEKRPKKLLDQVREAIRRKHYSIRTERAYVFWIKRYILFHHKRHPNEMGSAEIEAFTHPFSRGATRSRVHSKSGPQRLCLHRSSKAGKKKNMES